MWDAEDGHLDMSEYPVTAHGFLPVPIRGDEWYSDL